MAIEWIQVFSLIASSKYGGKEVPKEVFKIVSVLGKIGDAKLEKPEDLAVVGDYKSAMRRLDMAGQTHFSEEQRLKFIEQALDLFLLSYERIKLVGDNFEEGNCATYIATIFKLLGNDVEACIWYARAAASYMDFHNNEPKPEDIWLRNVNHGPFIIRPLLFTLPGITVLHFYAKFTGAYEKDDDVLQAFEVQKAQALESANNIKALLEGEQT
jgi:hypothetical protein